MKCEKLSPAILREVRPFRHGAHATVIAMPQASTNIAVDSSLIHSVTYGADATLTVRFHSGAMYRYFTVPRNTLEAFLAATSKGTYFNRHIRNGFPFQRVTES